jgi:Tol biopolymer transport system component/DNA-binding winged helix-turn-helix (wHTH) protein
MRDAEEKRVRFGPYEADLAAGELRKNGRVVRLQEQPFQILATLLDRAGEVVTREELRLRLWPDDNFGDFDQGLNTGINKLREALGDSAANPRFVETLPKRGYRFTHPVEAERTASPAEHIRPERRPWRRLLFLIGIAAALAITAAVSALLWIRRPAQDPQLPVRRFIIRRPDPTLTLSDGRRVAISPNGRHVAIAAQEGQSRLLWIQDLDQEQPRAVEGSEGALSPFWSPDSNMIGFAVTGGKLKKVSVNGGGPPVPVGDVHCAHISGGSWSPDGRAIVFACSSPAGLYMVPAAGGKASLLASPEMLEKELDKQPGGPAPETSCIFYPHFLPAEAGARTVLFVYKGDLVAMDLTTGRRHLIGPGYEPAYCSSGHLLFNSRTDLWARPFSLQQLRFSGEGFRIARTAADASVAHDGTLVYRDAVTEQLVWFDRRGARMETVGPPAKGIFYPALSPDGRRVAVETSENVSQDVWVSDLRGTRIRLTSHPATEVVPVWAPGGDEVAFGSYRAGNIDIFVRHADGGPEEIPLAASPHNERASDWSRDGQYILYSLLHPANGSDLWYLERNAAGQWEPHSLTQTAFNEKAPKLSPDGRYVAYLSDESGRDEVYVRQFPSGGRKWPVSSGGASQLRWSRNGREIFYAEAGTLMAVSVRTVPEFEAGSATRLFSHAAFTAWTDANYDVSADGRRFILPERVGAHQPVIHVVQNWLADFRNRR